MLRKKPPGDLLPGAHRIEREFRIISALAEHDVPVPGALHLCEDESIIGTPFYVMEYVAGGVCLDPALPGMTAAERGAIYASMAEVLAQLHGIDWQAAGLGDYGKHENYVARQIALWSRQYEASKTGEIAEMGRLMDWLPRNIPGGNEDQPGAWRLSARQCHSRAGRTNCAGRAERAHASPPCWIGSFRPSVIR